jgi:hypothetical protein
MEATNKPSALSLHAFQGVWKYLSNKRMQPVIYVEVATLIILALAIMPDVARGGFDYRSYFYPMAQGCHNCTYNPYFTEWFMRPFGVFDSWRTSYLIFSAVSMATVWWSARHLGGNPFVVLASATFLWILWLGQIDVLPALGLALAWWSLQKERRVLAGLGLLLLATKPQLGGFAILALAAWGGWRTLIIPAIAAGTSLAIYGLDWPVRWLTYTPQTMFAGSAWFYIAPTWLLISILGVFFVRGRREQLHYIVAATLAGAPFLGAYSYFVLLLFPIRRSEILAGYIPFALMGITGNQWWLGLLLLQPLLVMARLLRENYQPPTLFQKHQTPA